MIWKKYRFDLSVASIGSLELNHQGFHLWQPSNRKEPGEVDLSSEWNASWPPPSWGVFSMSRTGGRPWSTLKCSHLSNVLVTPHSARGGSRHLPSMWQGVENSWMPGSPSGKKYFVWNWLWNIIWYEEKTWYYLHYRCTAAQSTTSWAVLLALWRAKTASTTARQKSLYCSDKGLKLHSSTWVTYSPFWTYVLPFFLEKFKYKFHKPSS